MQVRGCWGFRGVLVGGQAPRGRLEGPLFDHFSRPGTRDRLVMRARPLPPTVALILRMSDSRGNTSPAGGRHTACPFILVVQLLRGGWPARAATGCACIPVPDTPQTATDPRHSSLQLLTVTVCVVNPCPMWCHGSQVLFSAVRAPIRRKYLMAQPAHTHLVQGPLLRSGPGGSPLRA